MKTHDERGVALVLALLLTSVMSVLAVSLMFLSQTETYSSMNYRMMSQSRFAGETAMQKASNFLLDSAQYTPLPSSPSDPMTNYVRTGSPVTRTSNGQAVVLSACDPAKYPASNYPIAAVATNFNTAAAGTMTAGNSRLTYCAYARLLSMQQFESYGGGQTVVQTWQVTGVGGIAGFANATVQTTMVIETPKVPANAYAAFATGNTCGSMYFHGNVTINSYDSTNTAAGSSPTMQNYGGHVGTNGNLYIQGSVAVQGNLSTPRTGVGTCTAGAVTALTEVGSADVTGSVVALPAPVVYPPPVFSTTPPTNTVTVDGTLLANAATACSSLGLVSGTNCTVNAGTNTITVDGHGTDVTLPSVNVSSGFKLVFVGHNSPPANVNINSLAGTGEIQVQANMTTNNNEAVVLKVAGLNPDGSEMTTPFDLSQMSWKQNTTNHKYDASTLQIVYGGSGTINMDGGNSQSAATIYAPNANFYLQGTQDLFGSVLAKTITNGGNASIHFDRRLLRDFYVNGHPMASNFSWQRN
jgi:hypothetical protein